MTRLSLSTAALSRPGGRPVNEDAEGRATHGGDHSCCVVADGLGGHGGGDVASATAVAAVLDSFRARPFLTALDIKRHIQAADEALRQRKAAEPALAGMHTTIVVLLSDGAQALWAHVGDSRLNLFRDGRFVLRTRDHSVPQVMADAGDIAEQAIRRHEDRSRLLRSLGDAEPARVEVAPEPCPLEPGDAVLLCTDGFWEYVLETEMEADLAKARSPGEWLELMTVDRLLRRAPQDHDNYTALAVFVQAAAT
jgi:serine/threonine protein phosphatase PrpC